MRRLISRTALLAVVLGGCAPVLSRDAMLETAERLSYTSLPAVFYTGSDERHDWFENGLGGRYRVPRHEILIDPRMPRTDDRGRWRYLRADGTVSRTTVEQRREREPIGPGLAMPLPPAPFHP